MTVIEWLLGDDTGISSETILAVMTRAPVDSIGAFWPDVPHDPDDFGRCYRLLRHFPDWRTRLQEVAARFPKWRPMVAAWDELEQMYAQVMRPDGSYEPRLDPTTARKLYERMEELEDDGFEADGWTRTSPSSWEKRRTDKSG